MFWNTWTSVMKIVIVGTASYAGLLVLQRISGKRTLSTLLVENGSMLPDVMQRERVTEDEVLQAVRSTGRASLDGLDIVLETNGKMSVVSRSDEEATAMANVE